ncbi:hypothetical protein BAE44_0006814 [Dichanthelium oligosanthes]|uniref:Uncharacterized protein n=1 Tax=Dichanthelium oligosanthes TaxID=888268 RepID=A0A1E5W436_9POAL|nr:hypothetical protein BAE44_0006814 [Dichanthelium oligosanthes]
MEKRKRVLELRDRLDRTLSMPDLAEERSLRALVKKQILASSLTGSNEGDIDLIATTRAKEVSEFLEMLNTSRDGRSSKVHGVPQKEWKVKQDTDQLRVMYREGPDGTPFHTLLAEGFADGPIDVLIVANLFIRYLEERVKVPWPVSEREALLHYFELEYLKEDVVIISDLDNINIQTHGFNRDGIPEAGDTVRIDVFGGFVLQRITKEKSFFRAIANMDIKLDFVPPWLINFISRQLIGSGHKLYQKVSGWQQFAHFSYVLHIDFIESQCVAVSTVATCDEDYKRALRGPLYVRIREYQDSDDKAKVTSTKENATEVPPDNPIVQNRLAVTNTTSNSEIVEEESEQNTSVKVDSLPTSPPYQPAERAQQVENKPFISPEVECALGILDTAIAVLRGDKTTNISTLQNLLSYDATLEENTVGSRSSQANIRNADSLLNGGPATTQLQDSREIRQQAYSLLSEKVSDRAQDALDTDSLKNLTASTITKTMSMTLRSAIRVHGEESLDTNGLHQNGFSKNKESKRARKTKRWPCCLTPSTIG